MFVINHHVVRLYIPVHDTTGMAEVERLANLSARFLRYTDAAHLQKFEYVESDIEVGETRVQNFKVGVMDVLRYQTRDFGRGVSDNIQ